jgi:hypothetical protein
MLTNLRILKPSVKPARARDATQRPPPDWGCATNLHGPAVIAVNAVVDKV